MKGRVSLRATIPLRSRLHQGTGTKSTFFGIPQLGDAGSPSDSDNGMYCRIHKS